MRIDARQIWVAAVALVFGLTTSLILAWILGENPVHVLYVLVNGAFGSPTDIGYSLFYATPLMLTGLSVAWAFRAGLFNIGAEGQMALGGVALAATGILLPDLPIYFALPAAFFAAFMTGGIWGATAGWIKAKRGCHEVLSTILLNFIAYGLSSFLILQVFKNPSSQVPETSAVGPGYQIAGLSAWIAGTSPLNWTLVFALAMTLLYGFIMKSTLLGFHQRMAGSAPEAGRRAGINMDAQIILAMFISGGLAGLAATGPVLGFAMKTREGFTSNAGFMGIAVALLGRSTPVGIVLSALLFGALTKGSLDLDMDTQFVSRDLATVIQAMIVLAVASQAGLLNLWDRYRSRRGVV